MMFRDLRADEIDCRVATCTKYGVFLLLYKDARCDMNILDETVGPLNWTRSHTRDNANCIVSQSRTRHSGKEWLCTIYVQRMKKTNQCKDGDRWNALEESQVSQRIIYQANGPLPCR